MNLKKNDMKKKPRSLENHWIVWMANQSYSWVCKKVCKQYQKKSYEDFWNKCRMIYIYINKKKKKKQTAGDEKVMKNYQSNKITIS